MQNRAEKMDSREARHASSVSSTRRFGHGTIGTFHSPQVIQHHTLLSASTSLNLTMSISKAFVHLESGLAATTAHNASLVLLALLKVFRITDVPIHFRESNYTQWGTICVT
ncbi:hypothetical protein QCA50_020703 [Cerrena zonata]|uniref:Uncharacterized protein n=1 Tax=Cerrena zonata TaxID=2478898 RepID=A0AAW0F7A9_9APHY